MSRCCGHGNEVPVPLNNREFLHQFLRGISFCGVSCLEVRANYVFFFFVAAVCKADPTKWLLRAASCLFECDVSRLPV